MAESEGESKFLTGFLLGFLIGVLVALGVGGSMVYLRVRRDAGRTEMAMRDAMREAEMARAMAAEARLRTERELREAQAEAEKERDEAKKGGGEKETPKKPIDNKLPEPDVEVDK